MTDFFRYGWTPPESAVCSAEQATQLAAMDRFLSGQQVIATGYPGIFEQVKRQAPHIELVQVPTYKNRQQVSYVGAGCWGIMRGTKSLKAAAAWVNWMIEPEHQGLYCSVSGFAPPRHSAQRYWTVSEPVKEYFDSNMTHATIGSDSHQWRQFQKTIGAPHWRAAAQGLKGPEQACRDCAAEVNAAILAIAR
jgi:ABC-type glycerol-3-phosphate transport system substrate-binding protein